MYIRCGQCKHAARVPPASVGRQVRCENCGRTHNLERADELGSTPPERDERILEYSKAHGVDLASACSILLGILSPDDAIRLRDPADGRAPESPGRETTLDPGFARAVAEGFLTRSEARRRGKRFAYASGIAQRHQLPMPVALLVTDNRLTLERALSRNKALLSSDTPSNEQLCAIDAPPEPTFWRWLAVPLLVALCVLLALEYQRRQPAQIDGAKQIVDRLGSPRDITQFTSFEAIVERNSTHSVTRITASHPRNVLVAFCESSTDKQPCTPLRVEPSDNGWIGVYERTGRTFRLFIQRDELDSRRFSTDGRQPVEITPPAAFASNRRR